MQQINKKYGKYEAESRKVACSQDALALAEKRNADGTDSSIHPKSLLHLLKRHIFVFSTHHSSVPS
jgi:hypothetical protein